MGIVVGPFDIGDWITMKALREDVNFMKDKDPERFRLAIKKEKQLLREFFTREAA